jgi:aminomethyltransferase
VVKLEKPGNFVGREALARVAQDGPRKRLVGLTVTGRGIARHGYPVFAAGAPSDTVTSGSFAPYLRKNIGLAYVPVASSAPGSEIEIEIRGRRAKAVVVPTPFYKRERK